MKKTPLYEEHCELGGKIIDFGGWALPVQYKSLIDEHEHVRNAAGLFDVSHMGEITVEGADAERFIQKMITNDIARIKEGQAMYSPMCYPDGGIVDDLLVYKFSNNDYLLIVNASNTKKDFNWLADNISEQVKIKDVSEDYAQLALQGPKAEAILQKICDYPLGDIKFFHFQHNVNVVGIPVLVSRTGYTGEDGFEIYSAAEAAPELWNKVLSAGKEEGIVPVGLGARDTLRFEAALPLYGQELTERISPLEAGLGFFVKLDKEDFIGKDALEVQQESGLQRKRVGFEMIGQGIPRSNYDIYRKERKVGFVTTGSFSPTLKKRLGLAIVEVDYAEDNKELDIYIRQKRVKAKVIRLPFYSKKYKK